MKIMPLDYQSASRDLEQWRHWHVDIYRGFIKSVTQDVQLILFRRLVFNGWNISRTHSALTFSASKCGAGGWNVQVRMTTKATLRDIIVTLHEPHKSPVTQYSAVSLQRDRFSPKPSQ